MFPTNRFSRSVSSRIVVSSSRCCRSSWIALASSRLVTPALIDASGVRRSWVTDENIAARSWFVSASSCASRARASSRARSNATAACRVAASKSNRSSRVNGRRPSGRSAIKVPERDVGRDDGDHLGRPSARNARTDRLRLDVLAVERDGHLTGREPERLQEHLDELVEHPVGDVAGEELRRQEGQQPRLAFARGSPGRARPPHCRRRVRRRRRSRGTRPRRSGRGADRSGAPDPGTPRSAGRSKPAPRQRRPPRARR